MTEQEQTRCAHDEGAITKSEIGTAEVTVVIAGIEHHFVGALCAFDLRTAESKAKVTLYAGGTVHYRGFEHPAELAMRFCDLTTSTERREA